VRYLFIPKSGRDSYELAKSFKAHKPEIFYFENDGKAGGILHKRGTVKILPAFHHSMHTREPDLLRLLATFLFKRLRGVFFQKVFLDIDRAFDNACFSSMDAANIGRSS
jgi:hypothetical protein